MQCIVRRLLNILFLSKKEASNIKARTKSFKDFWRILNGVSIWYSELRSILLSIANL